jgi:hypothetical protein
VLFRNGGNSRVAVLRMAEIGAAMSYQLLDVE